MPQLRRQSSEALLIAPVVQPAIFTLIGLNLAVRPSELIFAMASGMLLCGSQPG